MKRKNVLVSILKFMWLKKAYWLLPVILLLLLLAAIIALGASPVFPFVYSII